MATPKKGLDWGNGGATPTPAPAKAGEWSLKSTAPKTPAAPTAPKAPVAPAKVDESPVAKWISSWASPAVEGVTKFVEDTQKNIDKSPVAKTTQDIVNTIAGKVFGPIVSAGSAVLNTMNAGAAATAGSDYKRQTDNANGIITRNDISTAAINNQTINGVKVKVTGIGKDGLPTYNIKPTVAADKAAEVDMSRNAAAFDNATAFLTNKRTISGIDVVKLQQPNLSDLDAAGQGFAYDLTHDPLLLVNPVKVVKGIGLIGTGVKSFAKGANAARGLGLVSKDALEKVASKALEEGKAVDPAIAAALKQDVQTPVVPKKAKPINENIKNLGGKITKTATSAEKGYQAVPYVGENNLVIASGLDAMAKVLERINAPAKLEAMAKSQVSGVFKKTPTANVIPDFKTGEFKVVDGVGDTLGNFKTRDLANKFVKLHKTGESASGKLLQSLKDLQGATKEAAPIKVTSGEDVTIEANVPHAAANGKTYVYDGEALREFESTPKAIEYINATTDKNLPTSVQARVLSGVPTVAAATSAKVSLADIAKIRPTTPDEKAARTILQNVTEAVTNATGVRAGTEDVKYKSFEEMIQGIAAGDVISTKHLQNVIEAIDPSKKVLADVRKAAEADDTQFLRTILSGEGVQTMNSVQHKIVLAADFEEMIGVTGIGYKEVLGNILTEQADELKSPALAPTNEFVAQAETRESQLEFAKILQDNVSDSGDIAMEAAHTAFMKMGKTREQIAESTGAVTGVSVMDDIYERVSETAWTGQAILPEQINQAFDADVFSSIAGITRDRLRKSKTKVADFGGEMVDSVIKEYDKVSAALGLQGIRIQRNKVVTAKVAADVLAGADKKHIVYLHTGDIFKAFNATGGRDLLKKAFFSTSQGKKMEGDSFLNLNFGEAARFVLEADELGKVASRKDVIEKLLNGIASPSVTPTAAFAKKMPKLAGELADHMLKTDVTKLMKEAHLTKSIGLANQMVNSTKRVADNIFETLFAAMRQNVLTGRISETAQLELIRSHLRRLAVAGDFFKLGGGDIAEASFRSWSQILTLRGRVGETTLLDTQEWQNFRTYLNSFYKYEKPQNLSKADRLGNTKFTKAQQDSAGKRLNVAQGKYELVVAKAEQALSGTAEGAAKWRADFAKAQAALDRARTAAWKHDLETYHYLDGEWVPSSQYSYEDAVRIATEQNSTYLTGKAGSRPIVDTVPVIPEHRVLNTRERNAFLKKEKAQISATQRELSKSNREGIAAQMQAELDANVYERLGVPDELVPHYAVELMHARGIAADTDIKIEHLAPEFADDIAQMQIDSTAAGLTLKEKVYGFGNQQNVKTIAMQLESSTFRVSTRFAAYMDDIRVRHSNLSREEFNTGMDFLRDGKKPNAKTNPAITAFYNDMKPAIDLLFGNQTDNAFITNGITGKALQRSLEQMGLTPRNGFPDVSNYSSGDLVKWLRESPFGNPKKTAKGTDEALAQSKARESFQKSDMDPLLALTQFMQAIASTKYQTGLAHGFASRFSYLAEGLTYEQAIAKGYVEILPGNGGTNLMIDSLPSPAEGGLFPPHMAEQFGAAVRNWDLQFNKPLPERLKTVLQIQGMVKVAQTILAPGFQVNNFVGDAITALTRGVTNIAHWGIGARISTKYLGEKFATDYSAVAIWQDKAKVDQRKLEQLLRSAGFEGRELTGGASDAANNVSMVIKGKRVTFTDEDITKIFEDSGILEESIYKQDIANLRDNLFTDSKAFSEDLVVGTIKERAAAAVRKAERVATKLPGDLLMGHANAIRVAHALKVIEGRSWGNIQDAIDAAVKELAVYHPTAKSLSAFERKWGRLATSYYTWMRMAHVATFRMFMENNREINAVNKALYAFNSAQGYQPQNVGSAYPDQRAVADFQAKTVGTVLGNANFGGQDLVLVSTPPIIWNDVLNYWSLSIDLSKPLEENVYGIGANAEPTGILPQIGANITKNMAIGGTTLYEMLFRRDLNGKPVETKNINDVYDNFIAPNMGVFSTIGKTSGAYIPQNKRPENTKNPYTKDQQTIDTLNLLLRMRLQNVNDPKTLKSGTNHMTSRIKDFIKRQEQK